MIKSFQQSIQIIRDNWRSYVLINIIFYGLYVVAVVVAYVNPEIHQLFFLKARRGITSGALSIVLQFYNSNAPLAILATFLVNLVPGTILFISLPSLLVPFAGLLIVGYRLILWGFSFSGGTVSTISIPIFGLLFLEGQGYVLAAFGVYLHGMRFLKPAQFNIPSHKEGYLAGLKLAGKLYWLVTAVLLVAACYEVFIYNVAPWRPFPKASEIHAQVNFEGSSVKLDYSGSSVFYDDKTVQESDARIVGTLLEDIGYFQSSGPLKAKLSKLESQYQIELYLENPYLESAKVNDLFGMMTKQLERAYPERKYQVLAFCYDQFGSRKEKLYLN